MWLDLQKPTVMSNLANCIVLAPRRLAQLIATLVHYPRIVLMGLVDWSAFLELVLPTMWGHNWDNGSHRGHSLDGRCGSHINPSVGEASLKDLQACLGLWLVALGLIAMYVLQTVLLEGITCLQLPIHPTTYPPPPAPPPPYTCNPNFVCLYYILGSECYKQTDALFPVGRITYSM